MSHDSLVDEIRQVREALAGQFNYDLCAIVRHLKEQERKSGRPLITLPPRRIKVAESSVPSSNSDINPSTEIQ